MHYSVAVLSLAPTVIIILVCLDIEYTLDTYIQTLHAAQNLLRIEMTGNILSATHLQPPWKVFASVTSQLQAEYPMAVPNIY